MKDQHVAISTIISVVGTLEDCSAELYGALAECWKQDRDRWLGYAEESRKIKITVRRICQETISDPSQACISCEGLDLEVYEVAPSLVDFGSIAQGLARATTLETKAAQFYEDVSMQSAPSFATLAESFGKAARQRRERERELVLLVFP